MSVYAILDGGKDSKAEEKIDKLVTGIVSKKVDSILKRNVFLPLLHDLPLVDSRKIAMR